MIGHVPGAGGGCFDEQIPIGASNWDALPEPARDRSHPLRTEALKGNRDIPVKLDRVPIVEHSFDCPVWDVGGIDRIPRTEQPRCHQERRRRLMELRPRGEGIFAPDLSRDRSTVRLLRLAQNLAKVLVEVGFVHRLRLRTAATFGASGAGSSPSLSLPCPSMAESGLDDAPALPAA